MQKEVYTITGNDASNYEEHLGPLIFEPAAKALLSHLAALQADSILEIAAGTGRLTKHLRTHFPSTTHITATDINPDMLELAEQQLKDPSITCQLADAQQLPFPEASFDLVLNQFGLMFLPDQQAGVNEAFRVLKPGGHFVFTTWDRTAGMPLFKLLIDEIIIPLFADEDTSRFHTPFALHDPEQLNAFLVRAGFPDHKILLMKFAGKAESPQHIVNSYYLQHPLGRQVREKDPSSYNRIAAQLEQRLTQQFGSGPFDIELKAWVGIGTK